MSESIDFKASGCIYLIRLALEAQAASGVPMARDALLQTANVLRACELETRRLEERIHGIPASDLPQNVVSLRQWVAAHADQPKK